MPKITGRGTPSISGVPVPPQEFDQGRFFNKGEKDSPEKPDTTPDEDQEEETPSAGTNSSQSSASKPKTPEKRSASATIRRPAPSTANRSK
jgi:hypothetical protein